MYSAVQVTSDVLIADNEAGNGGGLFCSGKNARLAVGPSATLRLENNTAGANGGAVYLEDSASYEIQWDPCPPSCAAVFRGNGICDMEW